VKIGKERLMTTYLLRDSNDPDAARRAAQDAAGALAAQGHPVEGLTALADRLSAEFREALDRAGCADAARITGRIDLGDNLIITLITVPIPGRAPEGAAQ
jgi:hypothetical protein